MASGKTLKLNTGLEGPQIGFGTWQAPKGEVEKAVAEAIKIGYRHIDCALIYGNQNEVADGIRDAGVDRSKLFLVSKLWNNSHAPSACEADLDLTLSQLKTDHLDVWLMHWPVAFAGGKELAPNDPNDKRYKLLDKETGIIDTWKEMIRIWKSTNKTKAIGVSNFTVEHLETVINATGVVPVMNQIEAHPSLIQPELFEYCKKKDIKITAYSPLGNNITGKARVIDHPEIQAIAKKIGKSPAQVLIAWCCKNGFFVIPKSVTPSRIQSNFEDFELSDADFEEINKVGRANQARANIPAEYGPPGWPINIFGTPSEAQFPKVY